jgi:hypothetical protein
MCAGCGRDGMRGHLANRRIAWSGALFACLALSCSSRIHQVEGSLQITSPPACASQTATSCGLDFGAVILGSIQKMTPPMSVLNVGPAEVELDGPGEDSPFDQAFNPGFTSGTLAAEATLQINATFTPTTPGKMTSVVHLLSDSEETPDITITLTGTGVQGLCTVSPSTLDFCSVGVSGDHLTLPVTITNGDSAPWDVGISGISGANAAAFSLQGLQAPASVPVKPGETFSVNVDFSPNQVGSYSAYLDLAAPSFCQPKVHLVGTGVPSRILATPSTVDFGFVVPKTTAPLSTTLTNLGCATVSVLPLQIQQPLNVFQLDASTPGTSIPLAAVGTPANSASVTIDFTPDGLGPRTASLPIDAKDQFGTELSTTAPVALQGYGGGPQIAVSPSILDFGDVPVGVTSYRQIVIANNGQAPVGNPAANLRLVNPSAPGCSPNSPASCQGLPCDGSDECLVSPLLSPAGGDFGVQFPSGLSGAYDLTNGLPTNNSTLLTVWVAPKQPGPEPQTTLTVFSNDPAYPYPSGPQVTLRANAVASPPCSYSVSPAQLAFGNNIQVGQTATLGLTVMNTSSAGGQVCTISRIALDPGTSPPFSFVGSPASPSTLSPGQSLQVQVSFTPPSAANFLGTLRIDVSSAAQPETVVPLSGTGAAGCVTIVPSTLDLGTVKVGCDSAVGTFTIYDACTAQSGSYVGGPFPITVTSITPQGPSPSPFTVSPQGTLPTTLQSGQEFQVSVKYDPTVAEIDTASVSILANLPLPDGGESATPYVVQLTGKGVNNALQVDTFVLDLVNKVDFLIAMDTEASDDFPEDLLLDANVRGLASNFFRFADGQNIDYRIAVTPANFDDCVQAPGNLPPSLLFPCGELLSGPGIPAVVTPSTPQKQWVFNELLSSVDCAATGYEPAPVCPASLETDGTYFKDAYYALTPPLSTGANAGILRPDAALSILAIGDNDDRSSMSLNQFFSLLQQLAGPQGSKRVRYNALAPYGPEPTGCDVYESSDDGRDAAMIQMTGGIGISICTNADWSQILPTMFAEATGRRTFHLSGTPDPTTIQVAVNGVPTTCTPGTVQADGSIVCSAAGQTVWSYVPTTDSIQFALSSIPQAGDVVTVQYQLACLPP